MSDEGRRLSQQLSTAHATDPVIAEELLAEPREALRSALIDFAVAPTSPTAQELYDAAEKMLGLWDGACWLIGALTSDPLLAEIAQQVREGAEPGEIRQWLFAAIERHDPR